VGRHEQIPSATATTKNHQPARETLVYQSSRFEVPCGSSVSSLTSGSGSILDAVSFSASRRRMSSHDSASVRSSGLRCSSAVGDGLRSTKRAHRFVPETIRRVSMVHQTSSAHTIRRRILKLTCGRRDARLISKKIVGISLVRPTLSARTASHQLPKLTHCQREARSIPKRIRRISKAPVTPCAHAVNTRSHQRRAYR
jgi:hypothetical protein